MMTKKVYRKKVNRMTTEQRIALGEYLRQMVEQERFINMPYTVMAEIATTELGFPISDNKIVKTAKAFKLELKGKQGAQRTEQEEQTKVQAPPEPIMPPNTTELEHDISLPDGFLDDYVHDDELIPAKAYRLIMQKIEAKDAALGHKLRANDRYLLDRLRQLSQRVAVLERLNMS